MASLTSDPPGRTKHDARSTSAWRLGLTSQVALAYLLGQPAVTSLVVGAKTAGQLADNLAAADLALTAEERARLDKASEPPLIYPYWHQAKTARDRLSPADLTLLGRHI